MGVAVHEMHEGEGSEWGQSEDKDRITHQGVVVHQLPRPHPKEGPTGGDGGGEGSPGVERAGRGYPGAVHLAAIRLEEACEEEDAHHADDGEGCAVDDSVREAGDPPA